MYLLAIFSLAALSPEEERLWSIVRTNSLDFNAWTALIEETEKMSEVLLTDLLLRGFVISAFFIFWSSFLFIEKREFLIIYISICFAYCPTGKKLSR